MQDFASSHEDHIAPNSAPPIPPFTLPTISILSTPTSGRGVFIFKPNQAGTLLLTSSDLAVYTLNREYRREVCSHCFAYNRGQHWKLRDTTSATGAVWCGEACKTEWHAAHDEAQIAALAAVEVLMSKARGYKSDDIDMQMLDTSSGRPSEHAIAEAWREAAETGALITAARTSSIPTKAMKHALQSALSEPPAPGMLIYALQTVFVAYRDPDLWHSVIALAPSPRPYVSTAVLAHHITAYLQLLATLPSSLIPFCTPDQLLTAVDRDNANSFGLRSLDDNGAEMFGYGIWPSASFWNHSCAPNVGKRRVGRTWEFRAVRDVVEGEELSITYLGGSEETMGCLERRRLLQGTWGFVCGCVKCKTEEAEEVEGMSGMIDHVLEAS